MSATDDIKAEIAAINAKVDRLIQGIPERHLRYLNDPDASAAKIDELEAEVGQTSEIKSALDALNAKLDSAIADKGRYAKVPGDDLYNTSLDKPGFKARKVDDTKVEDQTKGDDKNLQPRRTEDPVAAVQAVVDNSLDPNNPALTAEAAAQAARTGARMG